MEKANAVVASIEAAAKIVHLTIQALATVHVTDEMLLMAEYLS